MTEYKIVECLPDNKGALVVVQDKGEPVRGYRVPTVSLREAAEEQDRARNNATVTGKVMDMLVEVEGESE